MSRKSQQLRTAVLAGILLAASRTVALAADSNPDAEQRILAVLDDLDKHQRAGMMNITVEDGRLLRLLTEAVNARHVVEIGTSNGYSGIWFCLALRTTGGKLTTHEIDARRAGLARENFKKAGVDHLVTLVEGDAHKEVARLKEPIDVLFLDADKQGYIDYLNKLLPLVRPGGLILAHNTTDLGQQMQDYLKAVTTDPRLETIFLHTHDRGVGVSMVKRSAPPAPAPSSQAAQPSGKPVLGYINHIPPETAEQRSARHDTIARRRQGMPIMVHRGQRDAAPENTLEAYAAAMDLGADGVEIDIRRSTDGVLFLHHDDELGRTAKGSGKLKDLTYYQILNAPIPPHGTAGRNTRIPTLAAFLTLARQRAMLLHLDVKNPGLQDDIERMIDQADMWDHVVEVNAGNAERLRAHPKVKLLAYKGWWPEGQYAEDPDAVKNFLKNAGSMVFCKDVGPAAKALKRHASEPAPLPDEKSLRAWWTQAGIVPAP